MTTPDRPYEDRPYDSVAVFSGGLDSTTMVYHMLEKGMKPHLLSFDYGQRHKKELLFAKTTAQYLELRWNIVDLCSVTNLFKGSALTDPTVDVPEGHYAEDSMKATVVPNRNMIMLSIAAGVAVANNYQFVAIGVHAGDHAVYPDCRPDFIHSMQSTVGLANEGFGRPGMYAPFIRHDKTYIAMRAGELNVPIHKTWSCYKGGNVHCGLCGTCVERIEALYLADVKDPTVYDGNTAHDLRHSLSLSR